MSTIKKAISCIMMHALLTSVGTVAAQTNSRAIIQPALPVAAMHRPPMPRPIISDPFQEEINSLAVNRELYCIKDDGNDSIYVAMLLRNKVGYCNEGEFTAKWKGRKSGKTFGYMRVFIPHDFMQICAYKGIRDMTDQRKLSIRLCQLLGLTDESPRDTIIYMKVPKSSLFRPAYNPDIRSKIYESNRGRNNRVNKLPANDKRWMAMQQLGQTSRYWTRMGYTFDRGTYPNWRDTYLHRSYFGVAEFVVRPNTPYTNMKYVETKILMLGRPYQRYRQGSMSPRK
jgi:hypothetical protein